VAIPDFWTAATRLGLSLSEGVTGVSATGPLSQDLGRQLNARSAGTLWEIYGSSETAGVGVRKAGEDHFKLLPWWRREDDGVLYHVKQGQGHVMPDVMTWKDDVRFVPSGRKDGAVQVGGVNVSPQKVAERLKEHGDVADAAVRPVQVEGSTRLKAFIVPEAGAEGPEVLKNTLSSWAARHLSTLEQPRHYTIGKALPRNEMGKLADWPVEA
jgi:4-coumarate--CoA ligase